MSEERVLSVLSDPRSFLFPWDAFEGEKKKKACLTYFMFITNTDDIVES